ncbi:hypothetical protein MNBD_PLANCTO02-1673 [hydrothermal vent metagenome]|uniref:Uncharacterized protein n=1 Tax=hydrothermal vent metagenome TaxID=652676 RepID=A0A3B1E8R1_9ZZZZ
MNNKPDIFSINMLVATVGLLLLSPLLAQAKKYSLEEKADDGRVFAVEGKMTVSGELKTAAREQKVITMPLKVKANLYYQERRLSGTGRDAKALRSLRYYERAAAEIKVAKQVSFKQLSSTHQLLVAQGTRERVLFYSPRLMMKPNDLELLNVAGDSLAILGLLPDQPVEIAETWTPDSWVIQMLTSTEAINKSNLVCKLESVNAGIAEISFEGSIAGATSGTDASSTIKGRFKYDIAKKHMTQIDIIQTEKRSVGATSPGMNVTAKMSYTRTLLEKKSHLTDKLANSIPLEPDAQLLLVTFDATWNSRVTVGRNWKVFHKNSNVAVLRLLEKGSLIAQCNISYVPTAAPGQHLSEKQFQTNIHTALGDKLTKITKAELLKTNDKLYIYRVIATGKSNGIEMNWLYYLCANPDGRQTSFVFAVESKQQEKLANRDVAIVTSIQFLKKPKSPQPAKP